MKQQTTTDQLPSTVCFDSLEGHIRQVAQKWMQRILEEEVTEHLGRLKSQRRSRIDAEPGYRNGYGKPRQLALSNGTISVRRPRVRGLRCYAMALHTSGRATGSQDSHSAPRETGPGVSNLMSGFFR